MFFSGGGGYLLLICQCVLQEELEVIEEEGEEGEDEYCICVGKAMGGNLVKNVKYALEYFRVIVGYLWYGQ